MVSATVEPDDVLYLECSRIFKHDAHSWREGFLWHRKRTCKGLTGEMSDRIRYPQKPKHKHRLLLNMYPACPFINPDKVVGHCECGIWCSIDKKAFYNILLGRENYYKIEAEDLGSVTR